MKFPIERKPQMSPVPGGELLLLLLQFIHNFIDRSYRS